MPRNKEKVAQLKAIKKATRQLLIALGRDLSHVELRDTPNRVAKLLYKEVCEKVDLNRLIQTSPYPYKSAVTVTHHKTFTRCPHHLERVELDVSIAYIPSGQLLGVSKLPRIADYCASGLMLQEELTDAIAEVIEAAAKPLGVAVQVLGRHMCMRARGVKSFNAEMVTTCLRGVYLKDPSAKEEFLNAVSKH